MSKLKWFSGGNDRKKQAESIIIDLLNDLKIDLVGKELLFKVLNKYLQELKQTSTSIPSVLSRMNLDISKAIRNDGVTLTEYQSKNLKELISLSNIRYGY